MPSPIYDTREGIASFLIDLESINRLRQLRHDAGYGRGERMQEWVVRGRWRLDTCGNFSPIVPGYSDENKILADMGKCPDVMTMDEAYLFARGGSITTTMSWAFPPHYATCKTCGEKWTLEDCHNFRISQDSDEGETSLEQFVGQRLDDVREIPHFVNQQVHFVDHDSVYNANLPDPVEEEKGQYNRDNTRLSLNKKKWRYVPKGYVVQTGDHAMLQFVLFEHRTCYQRRITQSEREDILAAFAKAGYPKVNLITRKNEYCPCDECTPWFSAQVRTETPIKIGWRKRVILVDWSETGRKLPGLFAGEDVTQSSEYVHAWGYDKLAEYLGRLMPALGVSP
jgi:hypothetical protein